MFSSFSDRKTQRHKANGRRVSQANATKNRKIANEMRNSLSDGDLTSATIDNNRVSVCAVKEKRRLQNKTLKKTTTTCGNECEMRCD